MSELPPAMADGRMARAFRHWARDHDITAFQTYLREQGIRRLPPADELVATASDWQRCGASAFDIPPRAHWARAAATSRLLDHLHDHFSLYGELTGVRSARKHIAWYLRALPGGEALRAHINTIEDCTTQWQAVADYLDALGQQMDRLPAATDVDADTEEQEGLAA